MSACAWWGRSWHFAFVRAVAHAARSELAPELRDVALEGVEVDDETGRLHLVEGHSRAEKMA